MFSGARNTHARTHTNPRQATLSLPHSTTVSTRTGAVVIGVHARNGGRHEERAFKLGRCQRAARCRQRIADGVTVTAQPQPCRPARSGIGEAGVGWSAVVLGGRLPAGLRAAEAAPAGATHARSALHGGGRSAPADARQRFELQQWPSARLTAGCTPPLLQPGRTHLVLCCPDPKCRTLSPLCAAAHVPASIRPPLKRTQHGPLLPRSAPPPRSPPSAPPCRRSLPFCTCVRKHTCANDVPAPPPFASPLTAP